MNTKSSNGERSGQVSKAHHQLMEDDGRPRDACGVFGIYGHPEAAKVTYFGLYALQHRGQESTGIAVARDKKITVHKGMGLVPEVLIRHAQFIFQHGDPLTVWVLEFSRVAIFKDGSVAFFRGRCFTPVRLHPFSLEHPLTP